MYRIPQLEPAKDRFLVKQWTSYKLPGAGAGGASVIPISRTLHSIRPQPPKSMERVKFALEKSRRFFVAVNRDMEETVYHGEVPDDRVILKGRKALSYDD